MCYFRHGNHISRIFTMIVIRILKQLSLAYLNLWDKIHEFHGQAERRLFL